jgi:hypothetical protein
MNSRPRAGLDAEMKSLVPVGVDEAKDRTSEEAGRHRSRGFEAPTAEFAPIEVRPLGPALSLRNVELLAFFEADVFSADAPRPLARLLGACRSASPT